MFRGKRFVTSGIAEKVPLLLQVIMWDMIDTMDEQKDYRMKKHVIYLMTWHRKVLSIQLSQTKSENFST